MSTLSQSERDGLEDVFLSIHSNQDKFKNIKEISNLIIFKNSKHTLTKILKQAKHGIKWSELLHFSKKTSQKKKNLSK